MSHFELGLHITETSMYWLKEVRIGFSYMKNSGGRAQAWSEHSRQPVRTESHPSFLLYSP